MKEAAAGRSVAKVSSATNCHAFKPSKIFMYPGAPFKTEIDSHLSLPSLLNLLGQNFNDFPPTNFPIHSI